MKSENMKVCAVSDAAGSNKLTEESLFACERCGATAHSKSNVCAPVLIEPDH